MSKKGLLVYPKFPMTYWSYDKVLEFIDKKATMPPLGLLTVAAMFHSDWELKVVDMNVEELTDAHLAWADYVFISAMIVQKDSMYEVVRRCLGRQIPVIVGGPFPTSYHEDIEAEIPGLVSHYFLGEAEGRFEEFLNELEKGVAPRICEEPKHKSSDGKTVVIKPSIEHTPLPLYKLVDLGDYGSVDVQFSRGCPWDCEFCDITKLFGRVPRTKTNEQMLAEFDALYEAGWRGSVFLVDDNFIGNRRRALDLLKEIAIWQAERNFPFLLFTEASVDLAEREELLEWMPKAGLRSVFLGIENPDPEALISMTKQQNTKKEGGVFVPDYLMLQVRKIQAKGLEVLAGFILGSDPDREDVFDRMIQFIQDAGIPIAMVGTLTALRNTKLYFRLQSEGRLLAESTGNNVSATLNFVPKGMTAEALLAGYKRVLSTLYQPSLRNYFERCWTFLQHLDTKGYPTRPVGWIEVKACVRSLAKQLFSRQGPAYAKFLLRVLWFKRQMFPEAVALSIKGYHFAFITQRIVEA
jgi:radical SAM superfamily enzyme YgiQ (UPF0313 family)